MLGLTQCTFACKAAVMRMCMLYSLGLGFRVCRQVVDETDRLLRQSYQNWLPHVVGACTRPPAACVGDTSAAATAQRGQPSLG